MSVDQCASAAAAIMRLRWEGHTVCETRSAGRRAKLRDFVDAILLYLSTSRTTNTATRRHTKET